MPKVKPIDQILDINAYAHETKVTFRMVRTEQTQHNDQSYGVEVPISIVYRLFHLGRAYDFQTVKFLSPSALTRVEYVHLSTLALEFERIFEIVNDPVARHYLQLLLDLLKNNRQNTKTALLIVPR
jgi:hypothetical protein